MYDIFEVCKSHKIRSEMPTPKAQNAGDFLGPRTFIVSAVKVFTSPCIISQDYMYVTKIWEIFVKCGRVGEQVKMLKSPAKCGRVGISVRQLLYSKGLESGPMEGEGQPGQGSFSPPPPTF